MKKLAEKCFKFVRKDGEVLYDELGKQAKATKEAEEILKAIQEFGADNKTREGKENKQTERKLNGELVESNDKLSNRRVSDKEEDSDLKHEVIRKVIEAFKDGPLVWRPCIDNASDSHCNVTGRSSYIGKETVNENGFEIDRQNVYGTEGSIDAKASSASDVSLFSTNLAGAEHNCHLEGRIKTRGEDYSNIKSANGCEGQTKFVEANVSAEVKGKAGASAKINAFKLKGQLEAEAEMDISGNASFVGVDIKTESDSDEFKAQFKIGNANADFKGQINTRGTAGQRCAKLCANAKGEIELNLVEGDFSHKSKSDVKRISHNGRQDSENRSSSKSAVEINAEAKTSGQIKFCHGKGSLNTSYKKEISSGENKGDGKNHSFDVTVADFNFAQHSKCEIKGEVSYDKPKSEKWKNGKRETSANAKAEGNVKAKSKGHAKLNVFEMEVANIGYNAKFEGKGKAEVKGRDSKTTYKQNGHEKHNKFCVASIEGRAQGEAKLSTDVNILNCKGKLGVEGKFEGAAKAKFELAEVKKQQTNGKTTREFGLIQGKADGNGKVNAKANIGKHSVGFDAEAEGQAELTLASGKADFNVKKTKNGYIVPGLNLKLGQAAARGRAKCDIHTDINHKKWQRKCDISGEARASGVNVQAFSVEINREKDHGNHSKISADAELARVNFMNVKATGKETGNAARSVTEFKGLEANIGNVNATGIDDRETLGIKTSSGVKANIGNIQATAIGPKGLKAELDGGAGIDCFNVKTGIHRTTGVSVATNRMSFCNLNLTVGLPQFNLNTGNCGFNIGIPFLSDGGGGGGGTTGGGGCENNDGENNDNIKDKGESRKGDGNKGRQLGGNLRGDSDSAVALGGNGSNYESTSPKIDISSGESGRVIDRTNRERITNSEGYEYWNTDLDREIYGGMNRMDENGGCFIGEVGMGGNGGETWEDTEDVGESDCPFSSRNKCFFTGKIENEVAHGSNDTLSYGFEDETECDGGKENTCKYQSSNDENECWNNRDVNGIEFGVSGDITGCSRGYRDSDDSNEYERNGEVNGPEGSVIMMIGGRVGDADVCSHSQLSEYDGHEDRNSNGSDVWKGPNLMEPEEYNKFLKSLVDQHYQKNSTRKQPDNQRETTSSFKESDQCYWSNTEQVRTDIFKQYTGKSEKEVRSKPDQLEEVRKYQHQTSNVQNPRKRQSEPKKPFGSNKNIHTIFTLDGGDSKPIHYIKNNVACFGDE